MRPLITVSIPIFKCEKSIERCIQSVFAQTYPYIEILLINDHTPDSSMEIVERLVAENPARKIRILHNETNSGLSVVRNRGILEAEGEFLYFLDSDDEITPDCIELLYQKYIETHATMVVGATQTINTFSSKEPHLKLTLQPNRDHLRGNHAVFISFFEREWPVVAWNKLIAVDFFRQNELYFTPGLFSQDELWSFHVAVKLDSIAFVDQVTYRYYLHRESVIFNKGRVNFENHQTIAEYFAQAYIGEKDILRKLYIKRHLLRFKEMTMVMQYKAMRLEVNYWILNYKRLKKLPKLNSKDYLSGFFSKSEKRADLMFRLCAKLGYEIFRWRWNRSA